MVYVVPYQSLTDPNNETITREMMKLLPMMTLVISHVINTGYELTGSPQGTCQSDGSWSGSPVSCTIMKCPSSSLPMNSMLAESCSSTYQSMCDLHVKKAI